MGKKGRRKRIRTLEKGTVVNTEPSVSRAIAGLPPWLGSLLRQVPFFGLFYFYLGWIVEPHLIFHGNGAITNFPSFYTTWSFFVDHLSWPGGPVTYLSAFLSQWFYHSPIGALIVTLQAWAMFWCIRYILSVMGLKWLRWISYVPAFLLTIIYGRYAYHFPMTLAMLIGLMWTCLYVPISRRTRAASLRPVTFVVLSLSCYYLAGGAFFLFVILVALHELFAGHQWRLTIAYTAISLVLPYIMGVLLFSVALPNAYLELLPISWKVTAFQNRAEWVTLVYVLYLLVPVVIVIGSVTAMLWNLIVGCDDRRPVGILQLLPKAFKEATWIRWGVGTLVLLGAGLVVAHYSFDRKIKADFAVDYYAFHRMWPEVLSESIHDLANPGVIHAVDRALCHTGRLGDEMFRWPQTPMSLFLRARQYKQSFWQSSDLYLDLGLINMAEHLLTESLEGLGDRPMILQRLAWINMVKGNLGTARVYLGTLKSTLFHSQWARDYLALLDRDPNLATDESIQRTRVTILTKDVGYDELPEETMLTWLLEQDKDHANRMAFEYLTAWYLLNHELGQCVRGIQKCPDYGYKRLPRHFEEAALVYYYATRKPIFLAGYNPSEDVQKRIADFSQTMTRYGNNEQAAYEEMVKRHYGSYFFYNAYNKPRKGR